MKTVTKLLIILFIITTSCSNKKVEVDPIVDKPEIIHLQDTYYSKFYFFQGFRESEESIKFLFDFVNKETGHLDIVTDRNAVKFDDGYSIDDFSSIRFAFSREKETLKNNYIRVNFLKEKRISFKKNKIKKKIFLCGDFETLDLNILQNMLDYAKEDENKKINQSFTYELYNKDNIKKVVIVYHNYGEWFSIDIL